MGKSKPDVLQGTLDLLILKTLARGPQHGYGIAVHIQQVSKEALRVEEGSLYPALHRIEQDGWIRRVGAFRKQSPREILRDHGGGKAATRSGREEMGEPYGGRCQRPAIRVR
jgi:DNA-binding PadR family transcriptional regulator